MCILLVNRLEDQACPVKVWLGTLAALGMTPWVDWAVKRQTIPEWAQCHKRPEDINHTIVKYVETFKGFLSATAKVRISLRMRAVWSGHLVSAYRIIDYCGLYKWSAKARMLLCACAGWSEYAHFVGIRMHFLAWRAQFLALREHAYSNILKILPPKNESFQMKNSDIFHISAQNIDCGYSLEPPRRCGSNEAVLTSTHTMFLSSNKKNNVYPWKPQFYYIKVGFKGVKII